MQQQFRQARDGHLDAASELKNLSSHSQSGLKVFIPSGHAFSIGD